MCLQERNETMHKDFADCKDEVIDTLYSCFMYVCLIELTNELTHKSTKNENELIQQIKDTVKLFAPELVAEASDEPETV